MTSMNKLFDEMGYGVWDVVTSLFNGILRTLDDIAPYTSWGDLNPERTYNQVKINDEEDKRAWEIFKKIIRDRNQIIKTLKKIIEYKIKHMNYQKFKEIEDKMEKKGVKFATKTQLNRIITDKILMYIINDASVSLTITRICSIGASSMLMIINIQGLLQTAANASHRLRLKDPGLWYQLSTDGSDMIYFIFEDSFEQLNTIVEK